MADHQQPSLSDSHQQRQQQQQRKRNHVVFLVTLGVVVFNLCLFRTSVLSFTSPQTTSRAASASNKSFTATTTTGKEPTISSTEDSPQPPSPEIPIWKRQLQESSMAALERMKDREALVSPYSTRESAIMNGFPSQWTPCTIHSLLEGKQKQASASNQTETPITIRVMILGGSCSARAAENCADETGRTITGRYSNILQKAMDKDSNHTSPNVSIKFDIVNLAQGSTNSVLNGLTLDTLVDPTQADILIWEFSPNEAWGYNKKDPTKIQFWLARVQSLFQAAGKPLPPILMIYLWERNIGLPNRVHEIVEHGLNVSVASALPTIEYHKQSSNRWNIEAISVGSTVANWSALAANPNMLMDDEIHPSCHSVHMISDMIQHAIHTNLATCGVDHNDNYSSSNVGNTSVASISTASDAFAVEPEEPPLPIYGKQNPKLAELWGRLIDPNVRIGSFTPWEPHAGGLTKLNIDKDSLQHDWRVQNTEKSNPRRLDRKFGYWLPLCPSGTEHNFTAVNAFKSQTIEVGTIQITILEPKLEWLGFGVTKMGEIRAFLNGVEVDVTEDEHCQWHLGMHYMKRWIKVADYSNGENITGKRESHTLDLCADPQSKKTPWLRQIVGVMQPEEDAQTANSK